MRQCKKAERILIHSIGIRSNRRKAPIASDQ